MYHYNNSEKKKSQYETIIDIAKSTNVQPSTACTLPGISGFAFENKLSEEYPEISVYCFEKNYETYLVANYLKPPRNVKILHGNVESVLVHKVPYDIMWLDYCGQCKFNQNDVERLLTKKSVFAITEFKDRGCRPLNISGRKFTELSRDIYGHMRFRCFSYIV
jgi:hypothetical protein